ncbi:MAG TPA: hypothetical protein VJ454_03340, partial [Steroidobacteraceae bacterium]|nr:hypothetical protein [Steroidobacteraceae bacterium]
PAPESGPDWIWCMVSDDMEVELMAKLIRLMVMAAAVSLVAPVWAQETSKSSPVRVVTKTLVASEAQKECLSLNNRQRLHYKFRADGPLNFKLSHQDEKEIIDFKRDGTDSASGSFVPRKSADHCLVWTNTGKHSVTLRYEYQRGSQ